MIVFKPAEIADASILHEFWGSELCDMLLIAPTESLEESIERLKQYLELPFPAILIAYVEGVPIGFIGVHSLYKNTEGVIHYGIRKKYQHLQYGTKMLQEFMIYLQNTEITLILAEVWHENVPSCRILEKCGFEYLYTFPTKLKLYAKNVKSVTVLREFKSAFYSHYNHSSGGVVT